jgi:hypothetical protein
MFKEFMLGKGIELIDKPYGQTGLDFGRKNKNVLYEVKGPEKIPDRSWHIKNLPDYEYPIVFDIGKILQYTEFYNKHQDIPQYIFLLAKYGGDWSHLKGWWWIRMYDFLNQYWKDKASNRGFYKRHMRTDELYTGKTNLNKWHIEIHKFKKVL